MSLRHASIALVVLALPPLLRPSPSMASQSPHRTHDAQSIVSFSLHADNPVPPGTTFWMAYGPLQGRFGIVRLRSEGNGMYTARVSLPASGRSVFAFVEGHGAQRTRAGILPGDPTYTVQRFGPVSVSGLSLPTVRWSAPVG